MVPQMYQEYLHLPFEKRMKTPSEFFHHPVIKEYLEMKSKIYAENNADYCRLKDIKKWLPDNEEHLQSHLKIDAKMLEYKNWFNDLTRE
jgi:ubiquinone/menaquinone biosynthesis C-methylase UbiE